MFVTCMQGMPNLYMCMYAYLYVRWDSQTHADVWVIANLRPNRLADKGMRRWPGLLTHTNSLITTSLRFISLELKALLSTVSMARGASVLPSIDHGR